MSRLFSFVLVAITAFLMSSCASVILGMYGIKNAKPVTEADVLKAAQSYDIPLENIYELKKEKLYYLFSLDSAKFSSSIQDHYQPLQILYYDRKENLISFHPNCYTGGFPNLKWNKNGKLNVFPPATSAPVDTIFPLQKQLEYLKPYSTTKTFNPSDYSYVVVVHWNIHMGRQSRRLIEVVKHNLKFAKNEKVKVIYVNNDNVEAISE
jgi:hypothetical protein